MFPQKVNAKITHKATGISLAKGQSCKIFAVPEKTFFPVLAPVQCGPLELDPAIIGSPLALLAIVKESYSELISVDPSLDSMKILGSPVFGEVRLTVMPVTLFARKCE